MRRSLLQICFKTLAGNHESEGIFAVVSRGTRHHELQAISVFVGRLLLTFWAEDEKCLVTLKTRLQ